MGKKTKRKKSKISIFHIVLAVMSLYVVVTFIKQEFVIRDLHKKNQARITELKELKEDVRDLEKKIDKSESVKYIEKIAREELDMVKPHEMIYRDKNKQGSSGFSN